MSFRTDRFGGAELVPFPGRTPSAVASEHLLPVLIVLHQESSTPGRVGNALRALGHRLDIRRPRFGDPLPHTLDRHAGAVVFGGPMSANDPDDYVRREIDWIKFRSANSGRSSASAWARRCWRCSSAHALRRMRRH